MIVMSGVWYAIKIRDMFYVSGNRLTYKIDNAFKTNDLWTILNTLASVKKRRKDINFQQPRVKSYPIQVFVYYSIETSNLQTTRLKYSVSDLSEFMYYLIKIASNFNGLIARFTDLRHKEDRVSSDLLHALEFGNTDESLIPNLILSRKKRRQAKDNAQALMLLKRHIKYVNSDILPRFKELNINDTSDINALANVDYPYFGIRLAQMVIEMRMAESTMCDNQDADIMALLINAVDDPEGLLNKFVNIFINRSYSPREPDETKKYFD